MIIKEFKDKKTNNYKEDVGFKNEKDAAYLLDFEFKNSDIFMVLHDLRLDYNGRTAQIDHLVLTPVSFYVIENKYFSGTVNISDNQWLVEYSNKEISIPSPIEQNERHVKVLTELLEKEGFFKKYGKPFIQNIVFISNKTLFKGDVPQNVIKMDQFNKLRKSNAIKNAFNPLNMFKLKIIKDSDMIGLANELLKYDTPVKKNNEIINSEKIENNSGSNQDDIFIKKLKELRINLAKEEKVKAYMIFSDKTLEDLILKKPKSISELKNVSGFGDVKAEKYGNDIIKVF